MNNKLTNKLFKKYPKIFPGGKNVNPKRSLLCFGIDVGNGWFNLIDKLCTAIQKDVDTKGSNQIIAVQVKEKLGGLRFYVEGATEEIHELINEAEINSFKICEECGKKGRLTEIWGWYKTLCKKCEQEKKNEKTYSRR